MIKNKKSVSIVVFKNKFKNNITKNLLGKYFFKSSNHIQYGCIIINNTSASSMLVSF